VARGPRARTAPDTVVVVDKPAGMTSHDVVGRVRRIVGSRKVGHAGTLDPMATGVLVLGVERATRLLGHLMTTRKAYDATIRLGISTVTDDAEGERTAAPGASGVTDDAVTAGVHRLTGDIAQRPTAVSAIKVDGVRSYRRVREGEQVELAARPVTVSEFVVREIRRSSDDGVAVVDVDVSVVCSAGTYVRALARDLGADLGAGGHLTALRRTAVGSYGLDLARSLEELAGDAAAGTPVGVPLVAAVRDQFGVVSVGPEQAVRVRHGNAVPLEQVTGPVPDLAPVGLVDPGGALLSLAERRGDVLRHLVVFS
jgi:tRNA pseudouridine55 synthase